MKGFTAEFFTYAKSLIDSAATTNYNAFVLDWVLTDGTALPVVRWIRTQPHLSRSPIYILSGNLTLGAAPIDTAIAESIREFALQFRSKPTSVMQLARDITAHLGFNK